jgi:uncharacterized damage-inducible protein DinB
MAIRDALLPEFDHEMATTRTLLERVPADPSWQPHPKSMTLGRLAGHLAELPTWASGTIEGTGLDMNPPGAPPPVAKPFTTTANLVQTFDDHVKAARKAIEGVSDADLMVGWTLKNAGQTIFTLPRIVVLRTWVMNHMIHHRGQLSVYLRLKGVPLPSIYGPTADM